MAPLVFWKEPLHRIGKRSFMQVWEGAGSWELERGDVGFRETSLNGKGDT